MTVPARLRERVASAAEEEGLLDVAYARADSPLGELLLAATPAGLVRVALPGQATDATLEVLARRVSPRILEHPGRLDQARREIEEYFEGRRRAFDLQLDWRLTGGFRRRVLEATARIPYGRTSTYAAMASAAGSPRAHRAAGSALGSNPLPLVVPCHRVLRSGGTLGGYGGGLPAKRLLLDLEGSS